ncbi:MAG: NAD(P)-dependent oxidoreductase [Bacteriovoracaceae bacterium]|nr:NAD(P)-dependent oxidoreductase [Bacteriovoracaceae bacterium]
MRILLTGGTGLLGSHIIDRGLQLNHQFVVPYRKISNRHFLNRHKDNESIRLIETKLTEGLPEQLFSDVDVIINAAAFASPFEKDHELMEQMNTQLPKSLYTMGKSANINKFIQISSTSVLGSEDQSQELTETSNSHMRETKYALTKKEADDWLDNQDVSNVTVIHPGFMLDKYDSRPSSGAVLMALKMKKFNYYTKGFKNIVAASDVANGIFLSLDNNSQGHFILGGTNIEIEDFLKVCCEKIGKDFNDLSEISREELRKYPIEREFCLTQKISSQKAMNELKYNPKTEPSQCLQNCLEWFQDKRMMRLKK